METDSESDELSGNESDFFDSGGESSSDESMDEDYDPGGIDSDDDNNGCCRWSTTRSIAPNSILPLNLAIFFLQKKILLLPREQKN